MKTYETQKGEVHHQSCTPACAQGLGQCLKPIIDEILELKESFFHLQIHLQISPEQMNESNSPGQQG